MILHWCVLGVRNTCFLLGQPLGLPGNLGWGELSYVSDFWFKFRLVWVPSSCPDILYIFSPLASLT